MGGFVFIANLLVYKNRQVRKFISKIKPAAHIERNSSQRTGTNLCGAERESESYTLRQKLNRHLAILFMTKHPVTYKQLDLSNLFYMIFIMNKITIPFPLSKGEIILDRPNTLYRAQITESISLNHNFWGPHFPSLYLDHNPSKCFDKFMDVATKQTTGMICSLADAPEFILGFCFAHMATPHTVELAYAIDYACRRQGIGANMVSLAEKGISENNPNIREIQLKIAHDNIPSLKLANLLGYKTNGRTDEMEFLFTKNLEYIK